MCRDESLSTEDIFTESVQIIRTEAMIKDNDAVDAGGQLPGIQAVMTAIDDGDGIPTGCTAHDVASTLLCYFKALPRPFFPESVSTVRCPRH
jgi:hypothetical protein